MEPLALAGNPPRIFGPFTLAPLIWWFILYAVRKSNTCWEEITLSNLHEFPNPMSQGIVITQNHWTVVIPPRRKYSLSQP